MMPLRTNLKLVFQIAQFELIRNCVHLVSSVCRSLMSNFGELCSTVQQVSQGTVPIDKECSVIYMVGLGLIAKTVNYYVYSRLTKHSRQLNQILKLDKDVVYVVKADLAPEEFLPYLRIPFCYHLLPICVF